MMFADLASFVAQVIATYALKASLTFYVTASLKMGRSSAVNQKFSIRRSILAILQNLYVLRFALHHFNIRLILPTLGLMVKPAASILDTSATTANVQKEEILQLNASVLPKEDTGYVVLLFLEHAISVRFMNLHLEAMNAFLAMGSTHASTIDFVVTLTGMSSSGLPVSAILKPTCSNVPVVSRSPLALQHLVPK